MIWSSLKELFPVASLPEAEAFHVRVVITHRGISIRRSLYVEVNQLFQIGPNDLIGVDKDHFLEVHGEENIKEQYLISPDYSLLLLLGPEPRWPFVGY